jgi:2-phosphosulfolactate phosphatase
MDTVESAFRLRERFSGSLLMGEVDGYPIDGFDLSNSPAALKALDLSERILIQRTTAGTQGVLKSASAVQILSASFVCASATVAILRETASQPIAFVVTGGDEDAACADYMEELLNGRTPDKAYYQHRVRQSPHGQRFMEPGHVAFPAEDLAVCLEIDRFDFAMRVVRENGLYILRVLEDRYSLDGSLLGAGLK